MNLSCNDDNGIILFRVISSHALNPHGILQRERERANGNSALSKNRTGVAAKDVLLNVNQLLFMRSINVHHLKTKATEQSQLIALIFATS